MKSISHAFCLIIDKVLNKNDLLFIIQSEEAISNLTLEEFLEGERKREMQPAAHFVFIKSSHIGHSL